MEMPLPGPSFDDRCQVILRRRHCGVGDDLGHVDVTLQPAGNAERLLQKTVSLLILLRRRGIGK